MSDTRQSVQWDDSRLLIRHPDGSVYVLDMEHLKPHRVPSLEARKDDLDKMFHEANTVGTPVQAMMIPVSYSANYIVQPPKG